MDGTLVPKEESSWWELYGAAMIETELSQLPARIEAARVAIAQHMQQCPADCGDSAEEHRRVMADALANLRALCKLEFKSSFGYEAVRDHEPAEEVSL
jgi:hypothetical protein